MLSMRLKIFVIVIRVLSFLACIEIISAESYDECSQVDIGSWVGSASDCSQYIYCDDDDSVIYECDEGEYFSEEQGMCDEQENVYCPLDVGTIADNGEEEIESEDSSDMQQSSSSIMTTTLTTSATMSLSTSIAIDISTGVTVVRDRCPTSDDPTQLVLLPHNEACSEYYVCYHGHAIEMYCTNHLHFNIHTGTCDFPENVQCLQTRPNANKCLPHITDFFPHSENCNYFYYCIKGFVAVQRCPFYYGWDMEKRACVKLSQAKCYNKHKNIH